MAYIGVPQPSRAITSADIAQGAVTLNDISFTDVPANMDISGTIDKHTMRLAEGVTVTGDITISDNLILSKISDDGVGITLTNDSSTRTITGSGSIEASTLAQTPNASLTGMTGTVGSAVTGSPNLNLGNATFPAGHVVQTKSIAGTGQGSYTGQSFSTSEIVSFGTFTPLFSTSNILLIASIATYANANAAYTFLDFYKNASDVTATANLSGQSAGVSVMNDACIWVQLVMIFNDTCSENSLSTKTYGISHRCNSSGGSSQIGWGAAGQNHLLIQEIAT